jgi:hypothetical protein
MDPNETWLEKWVLHEFTECANYFTCYSTEIDSRLKMLWEMFLNFELEHLRIAGEMLKKYKKIEPEQIIGTTLPTPGTFEENKAYVADLPGVYNSLPMQLQQLTLTEAAVQSSDGLTNARMMGDTTGTRPADLTAQVQDMVSNPSMQSSAQQKELVRLTAGFMSLF